MDYTTISGMFYHVVNTYPNNELYFYKKDDDWIGLNGSVIGQTVEDICFGLKAFNPEPFNAAIMSNNSPRWAMTDYGIICSGGVTVSVYPTLIASQVSYILQDSGAKLIFVENREQKEKVLDIFDECPELEKIIVLDDSNNEDDDRIINFMDFLNTGGEFSNETDLSFKGLVDAVNENDLMTLIYTSGTTGNPKGVMLTHKNLISNINSVGDNIEFSNDDVFLSFLPLSHVFERMGGHFTAFSRACKTYYSEGIEKVADNMGEVKPTVMLSVPRLYEKMYTKVLQNVEAGPGWKKNLFHWGIKVGTELVKYKLMGKEVPVILQFKFNIADMLVFSKIKTRVGGRLRYFISGGAPLAQEIAEFFAAAGITILEGYGLTETSPVLTSNIPEAIRFGTVGKPVPDVEIKIADDGEILARGPNIMLGYYNDEESTKEVISEEGWFHTGDIGELDNDGFLKITDRKKSLIVTSGGKNIAPAPLENAMITSAYIEQAVVIGDKRNFISALIVPSFENVNDYMAGKGESLSGNDAVVEHPEVKELIGGVVNKAMENFSNYERVKKFELLPNVFTIEKGELTPKMSIVRKVVINNYDEYIERIYADA